MIVVERESDGLIRKWKFAISGHLNDVYLRLVFYAEGQRPSKRHKLRGEFWDSYDERKYHSALPRPQNIPDNVIDEAIAAINLKVSIGWTNNQSVIAERKVRRQE